MKFFIALLLIALLAWIKFWVSEFVQMMLLEDAFFPGRFDKVVWGAAFIILPPFAPFAFWVWKGASTAERSEKVPVAPTA